MLTYALLTLQHVSANNNRLRQEKRSHKKEF